MAKTIPKMDRFVGRVAVLTGSTQGIGLASARRLGMEGCKVVISSRKQQNVDEAVEKLRGEGIEASGIVCDQAIKSHRTRLLQHATEKYGGFDCLFISAGANSHNGNLLTATEETYDHIFDMNVKSNFLLIQESVPHLVERGGGSILTNATAAAYDAVQSVMQGMNTGQLRRYEALTGIDFTKDLNGRFGDPEEIASIVSFLLSDDASYINGQCIIATGGFPFIRSV